MSELCSFDPAHNSEKTRPNKKVNELAGKRLKAAQDAQTAISTDLSLKEADQIQAKMSLAFSALPDFAGTQAQENAYYLSLTLGLLDELFRHIRDIRKQSQLELVEDAVRQLHRYYDPKLDFTNELPPNLTSDCTFRIPAAPKSYIASKVTPAAFLAFDTFLIGDRWLLPVPLMERKSLLAGIVSDTPELILSRYIEGIENSSILKP